MKLILILPILLLSSCSLEWRADGSKSGRIDGLQVLQIIQAIK
jgi:hypothetical protein